jgi:hypothetical protein
MTATILHSVLVALAPLALWLLKHFGQKLTGMLADYLNRKTGNEILGNLIKRIDDSAMRVVKSVYMTYVEAIKKEGDGVLSPEQQLRAKKMALDKLKSYLGPTGLEELSKIFNFTESESDKFLGDHVESAVYDLKHGPRSGLRNGSISLAGPLGTAASMLKETLEMAAPILSSAAIASAPIVSATKTRRMPARKS